MTRSTELLREHLDRFSAVAMVRERAVRYINMEEVQKTRKTEAQMKNGRTEDSRQGQK